MRAFVIAMRCEADAVEPHLKPGDRLYVAGIGKVNAAAATQKAICEGATEVWNAGLCGGFGDDIEVGDVFTVDRAVEYDFDLAKLNGTRVGQLNERNSPYIPLSKIENRRCSPSPSSFTSCILASGDRFNDSDDDLALLTELGATVRDMEGAAIAHVCKREGVRCRAVKCVTNVAGKGSMVGQYEENTRRCLERLTAVMKEILR